MISGKIWGQTEAIFKCPSFSFHRISIDASHHCSKHKHEHKYNGFFVESGELNVMVWQSESMVDCTRLRPGDFMVVEPGKWHQFYSLSPVVAFELYWGEFDDNDIIRENLGGRGEPIVA